MAKINKDWKLISRKDISPSKWFPLEVHTVALPNGSIIDDFYVSPIGNVVLVVAVTAENELILVEQYKHGIGEVMLELPGGMQQAERNLLESAVSELEEETGVRAKIADLKLLGKVANSPTKSDHSTHGYIVFDAKFNSKQSLDSTEDIEVHRYPAAEVLQMVLDGKIWAADSAYFILRASLMFPKVFDLGNPL